MNMMNKDLPLCVDLDGTLILTDSLLESFLLLIHKNILYLFLAPIWLCRGKVYFKQAIAQRVSLDPTTLPYHPEFLAYLKKEHQHQRKIILASATYHTIAEKIAAYLGIFSEVIATNANCNMKGTNKAKYMVEKFGEKQFVYAGNECCDLAVWKHAAAAIVVTSSARLIKKVEKYTKIEQVFKAPALSMAKLGKALRMQQWIKNILIFIPLLAAHKIFEVSALLHAVLAFLAFSTLASATYIMNDLLDLENDRNHPPKKQRMFTSGQLSILTGVGIMLVLLVITIGLSTLLPFAFSLVLLCYALVTLGYSLFTKRWVLCDIMVLAVLYTLRIIAGAQAIDVVISPLLMTFFMFIFTALASVKRYSE